MIKILFSTLIFAGVSVTACAQKLAASKVPEAVKSAFVKQYPGTPVKWEKEDGAYEAGFKKSGHEMSVNYSTSGEVLETETSIAVADLPAGVQDYTTKNFPGKKIHDAAKIVKPGGITTYEVELKGTDLLFDANGKFLKKQKD